MKCSGSSSRDRCSRTPERRPWVVGVLLCATGCLADAASVDPKPDGGVVVPPPRPDSGVVVDSGVGDPSDGGLDAGAVDAGPVNLLCRSFDRDIQPLFTNNCATPGCHVLPAPAQGLNLLAGEALRNTVGVPSAQRQGVLRIAGGDSNSSYLYEKISQPFPFVGSRMPLNRPPLSDADIELVRTWIDQGATTGEFEPCEPVLDPDRVSIVEINAPPTVDVTQGELLTLTATVFDGTGAVFEGAVVTWRSADEIVAYVDANGAVLGQFPGTASIIAQSGGVESAPVVVQVAGSTLADGSLSQEVVPVFNARCAIAGCHVAGPEAGALRLDWSPAQLVSDMRERPSSQIDTIPLVQPGDPFASFLYLKVILSDPPFGRQMPLGLPKPTAQETRALYQWIAEGGNAD